MATIQSFLSEIAPSSDEISQVKTSWGAIRDAIEWKLDCITSSKLTGSYIRWTKISPIDDLDIIFYMKWMGDTYLDWKNSDRKECKIYIKSDKYETHPLKNYVTIKDSKYYISPNKVLNQITAKIQEKYATTPNIKRNWECVTAYLSSYDLSIDCMPYTWVTDENYILIPTSWNDLYWKKSSPAIDEEKVNELNDVNHFNGKFKWVIRIMKYWNKHKNTWVKFRSYVLESWIYQILKNKPSLYNSSYLELLKEVIKSIHNEPYHNITLDIPGYDYVLHPLSDDQWKKIQWILETSWNKLNLGENNFITYLKS